MCQLHPTTSYQLPATSYQLQQLQIKQKQQTEQRRTTAEMCASMGGVGVTFCLSAMDVCVCVR